MDEIEAALITHLEDKKDVDVSQIVQADAIYALNTAFDQVGDRDEQIAESSDRAIAELLEADNEESMRRRLASMALVDTEYERDTKQQEESERLQLASRSLYVEDRTLDCPDTVVSVIHDETEKQAITEKEEKDGYLRVLGFDDLRSRLMASEIACDRERFTLFMLLKTLSQVIDIVAFTVFVTQVNDDGGGNQYLVTMDILASTRLTNEQALCAMDSFKPRQLSFKLQSHADSRLLRLLVEVTK